MRQPAGPLAELATRVLGGETRAVARALRVVDDRAPGASALVKALWPHTGTAWVIGVTGNPGAGKSTLCDRLIEAYRERGERVGVLAVDPSSPVSGGAILGDRIRMARHSTDDGVFIRSLATRGHLGGLSGTARDLVRVLDAGGYGVIIVETVGVGQDELEISRTAHSSLVVVAPGLGDEVQALKGGLLECADAFAVNKADREGAQAAVRDLEVMISLGNESIRALSKVRGDATHTAAGGIDPAHESSTTPPELWTPPIVMCVATRGEGTVSVVAALDRHRAFLAGTEAGRARRRERLSGELRDALREALFEAAVNDLQTGIEQAVQAVGQHLVDPYTAIENLVETFRNEKAARETLTTPPASSV